MIMFGKKKDTYVKLSEKEVKELEKNMSPKELKEFRKKQKQAEDDMIFDAFLMSELFEDD